MTENYDIIVGGHICLDLIPGMDAVSPEALDRAGVLIETEPLAISTGGVVSNTGLALHKLGVKVGLMGTVGDDRLGEMIVELVKSQGADTKLLTVREGQSTSYSVVLSPKGRDRSFLHCPGTNTTFGAAQIDYDIVGSAKIFHLGYPPIMPRLIADNGSELAEIYREVSGRGVTTSMDMVVPDPNGPSGRADWRAILKRVLPHVDLFLPSIDEALFMLRRNEARREITRDYLHGLAGELLDMGVSVAGFKLGELGFYVRTSERDHYHPAYRVQVEGTTGAGDAAYAGFLAAWLRGMPPHACVQIAAAVGACNVERADATSGVRGWDEVFSRIESGWPTREERLKGVIDE